MKNARVSLWPAQASTNPKAPVLVGSVQLPAQLVWELAQALQAGQFETDPQTGETRVTMRLSVWQGSGENRAPVLNGTIESPAERAAYLAQKAAAPANGWTPPAGPQLPGEQFPQAAPAAPAAPPWAPPAAAPAAPPAVMPAPTAAPPAPAQAAPAWGAGGGWG